jgi:hypothetical protein
MMHNTEDKDWWVINWRKEEDSFVNIVAPRINILATINPEKQNNPYAPDLIVNGELADLKCQQTPFFKSYSLYKIPNQYAITFNKKDFIRYKEKYPSIVIYYWLDWKELEKTIRGFTYKVKPMTGIWRVNFSFLKGKIESKKVFLHEYQRRTNDTQGNARDSYVFDVREFENLFIKE